MANPPTVFSMRLKLCTVVIVNAIIHERFIRIMKGEYCKVLKVLLRERLLLMERLL